MVSRKRLALALTLLIGTTLFAQADSLDTKEQFFLSDDVSSSYHTDSVTPKEDVLSFIDMDRLDFSNGSSIMSNLKQSKHSILNQSSIYTHMNHTSGIETDYSIFKFWEFEHIASPISRFSIASNYTMFFNPIASGMYVNYSKTHYPYEVSLSQLSGSLGDYSNRNVKAKILKGNLFNLRDTEIHLDFLAQNSYWTDIQTSQTAHHEYLGFPIGNTFIEADISSFEKDLSMYELLPVYWKSSNVKMKGTFKNKYIAISHPWASASILKIDHTLRGLALYEPYTMRSTQYALDKNFLLKAVSVNLRYEYADTKNSVEVPTTYNQDDYKNLLAIKLSNQRLLRFELRSEVFDWKRLRQFSEFSYDFNNLNTGLYSLARIGKQDFFTSIPDVFNPSSQLPAVDIHTRHESGAFIKFNDTYLSMKAAIGLKEIRNTMPAFSTTESLLVAHFAADWNPIWQDWEADVSQVWNYNGYKPTLMENPEYSFNTRLGIIRHLNHNNAISCGANVQGHTSYYIANATNPALIDGSTIIDLWAGIKIGSLFDFTLTGKNILSSSIYGVFPIPTSLHAGIRWYFIN